MFTDGRTDVPRHRQTDAQTDGQTAPCHNMSVFSKRAYNKRPQAKCPPTFEVSVCGEYVYNIYILNNVLIFYNPLNRLIFNFPICCKEQLTEKK